MDQAYWVAEYFKVLFAYGFVMYLWPYVVFYPHLKRKSRTYKFMFCATVSVMTANTLVLSLGLVHLLYKPVVVILYVGVFVWRLLRLRKPRLQGIEQLRQIKNGTLKPQRMLYSIRKKIGFQIHRLWRDFLSFMEGRWQEYGLLVVLLVFGTIYFSWNALVTHVYGCGDQYVHHEWIYGLKSGKAFSGGIYPEGMHCYIYLLCELFSIQIYSGVLFLGGIHSHTLLISIYFFAKRIFHQQSTALLVLSMFLLVRMFPISRISWTLPMEFAYYCIFLCAITLIQFITNDQWQYKLKINFMKPFKWIKILSDENLLIFMLSIAITISVHFYTTIFAVFVCVPIAAFYFFRLIRRKYFVPLAISALCALLLAILPMIIAYIQGIPLQGSLYWAMNVTKNSTASSSTSDYSSSVLSETNQSDNPSSNEQNSSESSIKTSVLKKIQDKVDTIISKNYAEDLPHNQGKPLFYLTAAMGLGAFLIRCFARILHYRDKSYKKYQCLDCYIVVPFISFFLFLMYYPRSIGLPTLVDRSRLYFCLDIFIFMVYGCVANILFAALSRFLHKKSLQILTVLLCIAVYPASMVTNWFHSYLGILITRYPIAVDLTQKIITSLPRWKYTIVSTTDELYQVIESGYHEEIMDLLEKQSTYDYTIPTPYIFVYLEKHPLNYAQNQSIDGPSWIAKSEYMGIIHGEISSEKALKALSYGKKRSDTASTLKNREILESKAYAWYQEFTRLHPNAGQVVYEDEDFLCYCIHQNEYSLYTLSILPEAYYIDIVDTTKENTDAQETEEKSGDILL